MSLSLHSLSDLDILSRTRALTAQERKLTLNLLLHLNEIERRGLHLTQGYASMFMYSTAGLGYSESAANRRIRTARCIARFPQVLGLLKSNEVNLSTVSQVCRILTVENVGDVMNRIRHKSQRTVDAIIAEYEPRAVLPSDRVRSVVVPVSAQMARVDKPVDATAPVADLVESGGNETHRRSGGEKSSSVVSGGQDESRAGDREELQVKLAVPGAAQLERCLVVQFTARQHLMVKLDRVRALASHRLPVNAPLEQLIGFMAEYFIHREDPGVRHVRREARPKDAAGPQTAKTASGRAIPARLRDEVFTRDGGRCSYVGPDGTQCGSTHVLQIDHVLPVARGGAASMDNLRLLCAFHNRLEAERVMGRSGPRR
jgi:5-methylcytosine-specific restriction endonuclease McrA